MFALLTANKNSAAQDKDLRREAMEEDQESLQLASMIRNSSEAYAIQNAERDTLELDQYAGESALSTYNDVVSSVLSLLALCALKSQIKS